MKNGANSKGPSNRTRVTLATIVAAALVLSITPLASGQEEQVKIDVTWHEGGMDFDINLTKGLPNVIVLLCDGAAHKHEDFDDDMLNWTHREDQGIVAIWVKSGNNHDPEGTAPPEPFDNSGAGEYFTNPTADCEEEPEPEPLCEGPASLTAIAHETGIQLNWTAFENSTSYNIYRGDGDADPTLLTSVSNETLGYFDDTVEGGIVYTYYVTSNFGETEGDVCNRAVITAIPVFPTWIAGSLAAVIGVGAYVFGRRHA